MKIMFLVDTEACKSGTICDVYTDEYGVHCIINGITYMMTKSMLKNKSLCKIIKEDT